MEDDLETSIKLQKRDVILSIKYLRIVRFFLSTISAWPYKELSEDLSGILLHIIKFYSYYLPIQEVLLLGGSVCYMCVNELDIMTFGDDLLTCLLIAMTLTRLLQVCYKEYKDIFQDFLMKFHLVHFKHKGSHFEEVYKVTEKFSYYLTVYTCGIMLFGCTMFNISPFYTNYKSGAFSKQRPANITYAYSGYYSFPFFELSDHLRIVTIVNMYLCYNSAVVVCVIDLLLSLMAINIIGHIVILRKSLENIDGPEKAKGKKEIGVSWSININAVYYSKFENNNFAEFIEDFVKHHIHIMRFTDRLSSFFGPLLAYNYTFHLIGLCTLLLESTQGDLNALIRFGPLTLIIFGQLIQISVIFEIVGTVSEKLPETLYCIPWECLDIRNQRSVCILLHRLQRPINVTAMGMTTVGVTTMAGILKTTFSYFAFLRSLNE